MSRRRPKTNRAQKKQYGGHLYRGNNGGRFGRLISKLGVSRNKLKRTMKKLEDINHLSV